MNGLQRFALSGAALLASAWASYAGPCSADIGVMQRRIDAILEAKAAAGLAGKESVAAGMSHQPTPQSPEAAEEGAGGGTLLTSLLPILQGVANNVDIGQLVGQAVGGGVSGAILTAIVGLIKNVMAGEGAK